MEEQKVQKSKPIDTNTFIKKVSINIFLAIKELENSESSIDPNILNFTNKIKKIDKDLLKHFNIKLSEKQKNEALEFFELMK